MTPAAAPYLALLAARFRALLQYRAAALGGLFTQTLFGLIRIMILAAFYEASAAAPPLPLAAAIAYVWLGQAVFLLFPWAVDPEIRALIRTGDIAYELCRPLDLHALWFARALAARSAPVLLRLAPMAIVAAGLLPLLGLGEWALPAPASAGAGALWLASFLGALLLSATLTTAIHAGLLWTGGGEGVPILTGTLALLAGGLVIPLPLFPGWAQPILLALPFAGMLDLPARVYTGAIPLCSAGWVLLHQALWSAALFALGRWLLGRQLQRIGVQGG
jgi:ABC-2 type transport system permease protein